MRLLIVNEALVMLLSRHLIVDLFCLAVEKQG